MIFCNNFVRLTGAGWMEAGNEDALNGQICRANRQVFLQPSEHEVPIRARGESIFREDSGCFAGATLRRIGGWVSIQRVCVDIKNRYVFSSWVCMTWTNVVRWSTARTLVGYQRIPSLFRIVAVCKQKKFSGNSTLWLLGLLWRRLCLAKVNWGRMRTEMGEYTKRGCK